MRKILTFVLTLVLGCAALIPYAHRTTRPKGYRHTAATNAHLVYNGGPLIQNVEITTIFLGPDWVNATNRATDLNNFFQFAVQSSMVDQLAEYSINGMVIGRGKFIGTFMDTTQLPSTIDDAQLQTYLQELIRAGKVSQPDANSLYFIFIQSGTTVTLQGQASCQNFCGYHNNIGPTGPYYAVVPYPSCSGCQVGNGNDPFSAETVVSGHELSESITDPIPGSGWYDQINGEIGDICEGTNKNISQ